MNQHEKTCYETDISNIIGKAEKVVFPKNVEEVKKIISTKDINIVPRGAGTGFVGGVIPDNSTIVDMSKMTLISNFNPSKRSVYVEAGVSVKELNEKLNSFGFEFPIVPSNNGISSIGGMIATNASGNRSMKYGVMKDWIEEIEFVNGKGELIKTSKADLMEACSMEGITGIIIGAKLKILPVIERSISVFQSDNLAETLAVARDLKQERDSCMLAFFSKEVSKLLGFSENYHIIVEFDSLKGRIKGEEYKDLAKIKERAYFSLFSEDYYISEDPKLFFDKIKEFSSYLEENKIPYFGDLGTGIIHPFFKRNEKEKHDEIIEVMKKMNVKFGKYGYGLIRKSLLDSFESRLIQRIKARQDPDNKFNVKKLVEFDISIKKSVSDYYEERGNKAKVYSSEKPVEIRKIPVPDIDSESKERKKSELVRNFDNRTIQSSAVPEHSRNLPVTINFSDIEEARKELDEKGLKTPDEKLHDFIKEIEVMDKVERKADESEIKKDLAEIGKEIVKEEIKKELFDYEQTFKSELSPEKVKEVEKLAREIPREIIKEEKISEYKKPSVDYSLINNILTNNVNKGRVTVSDRLDEKSGEKNSEFSLREINRKNENLRGEKSDSERDMINKILGNRYKKDEDKKENI